VDCAKWVARNDKRVFLALFVVLCLGFFVRASAMGYGVGSGGNWYYAWLTSMVIDHDIDFANQAKLHPYLKVGQHDLFYERFAEPGLTPTGRQGNGTAMGSALLWMPFFIVAHVLVLFLNLFGAGLETNGYSLVHQVITMMASIGYATVGMFIAYRTAAKWFDRTLSLIAALAMLFGFATIQYVMIEPSISHAMTIFSVSCFLAYFVLHKDDDSWKKWVTLGALAGMMMLTRWQEGFFVVVPLVYWLRSFWCGGEERLKLVGKGIAFVAALLVVFSPQLVAFTLMFGSPFSLPPESRAIMDFAHPLLWTFTFSFHHSLVGSTPIVLLALMGIPALWRRDRTLCGALVCALLVFIYVNASLQELGGNAFGARRMIDHFFVFTVLLAGFLDGLKGSRWLRPVLLLMCGLVTYNLIYMLEYDLNIIHRVKPVTPADVLGGIPKIVGKFRSVMGL